VGGRSAVPSRRACSRPGRLSRCGVESQSRLTHGSSDTWPGTENPAFHTAGQRTLRRSQADAGPWNDPREEGQHPDPYVPVGLAAENTADLYGITRTRHRTCTTGTLA